MDNFDIVRGIYDSDSVPTPYNLVDLIRETIANPTIHRVRDKKAEATAFLKGLGL